MKMIVPAIIAKSFQELSRKVKLAESFPGCRLVQLDLMDGRFVPNTTIGVHAVKKLLTRLPFELHLMVKRPEKHLREYLASHARRIILHYESTPKLLFLFHEIQKSTIQGALALSPETPVRVILPYVKFIDSVLLLSVKPGFYGSRFRPSVYRKMQWMQKHVPQLPVAVDGGINLKNAKKLLSCGAERLAVGSKIFQAEDPKQAYQSFQRLVHP